MKRYELVPAPFGALFDNLFSDALPTAEFAAPSDRRWAQFRVKTKADGFAVEAELAGVKKEDLKIEVLGDTLKVSGFRGSKDPNTEGFCEYGEFTRSFTLGNEIDTDRIEAKFENGYLNLSIPRAENKKAKLIDVK